MKIIERCPCYQCICVAVCRLKRYFKLTHQCSLVFDYLYMRDGGRRINFDTVLIKMVSKILDPCWYVVRDRNEASVILHLKHLKGVKVDE